ncbi:MAG: periplasmic heavy metal sensor [Kordiimonadaceae bacterium]|nr:periplasmic heavy metal sensor [Kordiimonadaceae bacterium]
MTGKMKWLIAAFVVSLGLNVFAAGITIGKSYRGHPPPPHPRAERLDPNVIFNVRRISKHLSTEDRSKMKQALQRQRLELRARYTAIQKSQKRIKDLLKSIIVDKVALEVALESHTSLVHDMRAPMNIVLLEVIADLDQETRVKMVEDFFKPRPGHFGKRRRGPRRGHDGFRPSPGEERRPPPREPVDP